MAGTTESKTIRTPRDLARFIDHTVLDLKAGLAEITRACDEAREYNFAGVCVRGNWVSEVARRLAGTSVLPVAVVDFPEGMGSTTARALEARNAVVCGAEEIDVVLPIDPLKRRDYRYVLEDLVEVVGCARVPVKVILETCRLTEHEKVIACALAKSAGAAFVKTSTGMGSHGATVEDVALMRSIVGEEMGVKASGGIRTTAAAMRMVEAGANRIGASASLAIVNGTP